MRKPISRRNQPVKPRKKTKKKSRSGLNHFGAARLERLGPSLMHRPVFGPSASDGPVVRPGPLVGEEPVLRRTGPPLLLMPMRLEYRVVDRKSPPKVIKHPQESKELRGLRKKLSTTARDDISQIRDLTQAIREQSDALRAKPTMIAEAKLETRKELWLRWYPDSNFSEGGIAPASETEQKALDAFLAHPRAADWPKLAEGECSALWAELSSLAGSARAVHLMRSQGQTLDPNWEDRIGRITGLPERVAVFAVTGDKVTLLGEGKDIPENPVEGVGEVSYSPEALGDGSWMTDFDTALDSGMATKIQTEDLVEIALKADWLVCTGVSNAGVADLQAFIEDGIADGSFEVLSQDTPTNNTPGSLAGSETSDSAAGILWDHTAKELTLLRDKGIASDLLSSALGLDIAQMQKAKGAEEAGQLDAAAMVRVIGPALMDNALDAAPLLEGVEDTAFIEILANHVQARGLLPALRFGDGAYGVLPITDDGVADNDTLAPAETKYSDFIRHYAAGLRTILADNSGDTTLRIEPDDPDASEKMTDILQTERVSRRLDVSDAGEDEIRGLGCPYVEGKQEAYKPAQYLKDILRDRLIDLPVADHTDTKWPLLYRLAHLSLVRNRELEVWKGFNEFVGRGSLQQVQGEWQAQLTSPERRAINQSRAFSVRRFSRANSQDLNLIPSERRLMLTLVNQRFEDSIERLRAVSTRPDGAAQLETLMMETIDLFQHRLDAWITGLASIRLQHLREKQEVSGLALGWYGFLGPLRETSVTASNDGYIQAPSQGQAVSAAILRSAFLRNRESGAFEIDLSSARTQRALRILDHLRRGVSLPETLGLAGERWLRNKMKSAEIYTLRHDFPLENTDIDGLGQRGKTGVRCFDGLKLVEATPAHLNADGRAVRSVLLDDFDALSDLVVAEAVHHRTGGSSETAAAWLRVLSGGPIPDRPEFLRTERVGHASDYRVTLVLPQDHGNLGKEPLELAEYGLAALLQERVAGLADAIVTVRLSFNGAEIYTRDLRLSADLWIEPMAVAKLGLESVRSRILDRAVSDLHKRLDIQKLVGLGAHCDRAGLEAAGLTFEIDLQGVDADITEASQLWAMAHAAKPLTPAELSIAASVLHPLEEADHLAALTAAAADIWARAERMYDLMKTRSKAYQKVLKVAFQDIATHYEGPQASWGDSSENDHRLRVYVESLHRQMRRMSAFHLEGTDTYPAASRLVENMVDSEAALRKPLDALNARKAELKAARAARPSQLATVEEARNDLQAGIEALRAASGVSALAIFPIYEKSAPLSPMLSPQSMTPSDALGPWPRYRAKLSKLLGQLGPDHKGFAVHPDATADDQASDSKDTRDEAQAPRSYHRGVFMARQTDMQAGAISGLIIDEWTEKRPSVEQPAAIALNYDTPQAEAPNCLLLCVPAEASVTGWTETRAADHVRRMLDLMKLRALTTQSSLLDWNVLPLSNRVAHVGSGANSRPRIPEAKFKARLMDWFDVPGRLRAVSDDALNAGISTWNQTQRRTPRRRPR